MKLKSSIKLGLCLLLVMFTLAACSSPTATVNNPTAPANRATEGVPTATVAVASPTSVPATATVAAPTATTAVLPTTTAVRPNATATPVTQPTKVSVNTSPQAIRQTKWLDVLKADPGLSVDPNVPTPNGLPFLSVNTANMLGGIPILDNIIYLDLDGDGIEEATFPLNSGGTSGNIGFLVYQQATPAPRLVTWGKGYKLFLKQEQSKLVVVDALYAGWEPNCCPSGNTYTTYTLSGNKLNMVGQRSEGNPASQPFTVETFYNLISEKRLDEAYKMLAPAYQKANPYANWSAGFATTRQVEATAEAEKGVADSVLVEITSTDSTSGGGQVTKRFSGKWRLEWSSAQKSWLLVEPVIREVTTPATSPKGTVAPVFQALLPKLKGQSKVAVFLPTTLEGLDSSTKIYAVLGVINVSEYYIILGATPDCNGGNACRAGTISAEMVGVSAPVLTGTKVALANGITGYFEDAVCGANCSDATVKWQQGNALYTVGIKVGKMDALVKMANSAITNGQL